MFKKIEKEIRKYAWIAGALFLLSHTVNLITPSIMQYVVDEGIANQNINQIILGILSFVLIPCIFVLITSLFNYVTIVFARNKGNEYSIDLMRHLLLQPLSFFDKENSIELMTHSGREISKYLNFKISDIPKYYVTIVISVFLLVILCFYHPLLAILQLCFIPLGIFPVRKFQKIVNDKVMKVMEYNASMNQSKADTFQAVAFVKSNQLEEKRIEDINHINQKIVKLWGQVALLDSLSGMWMSGFVTSLFTGMSFGLIAYLIVSKIHLFSYGEMFSIMSYCALLYSGFCTIFMTQLQKTKIESEFTKTFSYFDQLSERKQLEKVEIKDKIVFDHVDFAYNEEVKVLDDFSWTFEMNKWNGIEGESGKGKSTILKLIEKFYDIDKGDILIDGTSISRISTESLYSQITYVAQKPSLFPMTIRENLYLGKNNASDEEIKEVLEAVGLYDAIMALPQGLESDIKEAGKLLSGGQQQRLSIAIALLRNTKIYLLDEICANVDKENAEKIRQYFADMVKKGVTIISVSHDHAFHKEVDSLLKL